MRLHRALLSFALAPRMKILPPFQAPVPIIDHLVFAVYEFMSLALNNALLTFSFVPARRAYNNHLALFCPQSLQSSFRQILSEY